MPDWLAAAAADSLLILAPTGRDSHDAALLLGQGGIVSQICPDIDALCDTVGEATGAVLVADEALARVDLGRLARRLAAQPPWSDLPFIVLTRNGGTARRALAELHLPEILGNVVFLERPLNALSLVSAVRSAIRSRRRQRQVGEHLLKQQAAATALRESEARFRHMADSAPALIWMTDATGQLSFTNMHHHHMFGRTEADLLRDGWTDLVVPEDREQHTAAFLVAFYARADFRTETRVRDTKGQVRWLLCEGVPRLDDVGRFLGYTGCNVDITEARLAAEELERRVAVRTIELSQALAQLNTEMLEREQAEEALRQAQKMEAIGQFTGGIAHDFNNMLQGIAGSLELMQHRVEQGRIAEAARYVDAARKTVERAAALTHRLLAFARRQVLAPKLIEPDALIEGLADLIQRTLSPQIEFELRLGEGVWTVLSDPNQLENVLLNLAINARDAMPDGGRLTISTADVRLVAQDLAGQGGAKPGDYVEIAVADSGTGMTPDVLARAFEPFFTTKPTGQGTGLGLSQLYGFVRQSDGVVRLESVLGQGTTVRLYLPRHLSSTGQETLSPEPASTATGLCGGTILVVEDEEDVRTLVCEILRELGCRVLEAKDGLAGLEIVQSRERIDVLVTDVGLPGLNGRQLADAARERRPGIPVLLITGYAGSALTDWQLAPGMEVVSKPFRLETLASKVGEILKHQGNGVGSIRFPLITTDA